jgi:hypothetical protein
MRPAGRRADDDGPRRYGPAPPLAHAALFAACLGGAAVPARAGRDRQPLPVRKSGTRTIRCRWRCRVRPAAVVSSRRQAREWSPACRATCAARCGRCHRVLLSLPSSRRTGRGDGPLLAAGDAGRGAQHRRGDGQMSRPEFDEALRRALEHPHAPVRQALLGALHFRPAGDVRWAGQADDGRAFAGCTPCGCGSMAKRCRSSPR